MKVIGIFGTSGMAREAGDIVWELGSRPLYIARDQDEFDSWAFPDEIILESEISNHRNMSFVIGIGDNAIRETVSRRYSGSMRFTNLVHPSATFGRGQREVIETRQGVIVCAGVRFTNNIQVGNFTIFNQNATVAHDILIEDFVHVAPGAAISGNVHLRHRCWIGAGAVINQGDNNSKLTVNADTVVGSGAVIIEDCEANGVYVGVPAKRIK